jgi:hypothetical protein
MSVETSPITLRPFSTNTLVGKIRTNIKSVLSRKTSWGRVELMPELEVAINNAVTETLDELMSIQTAGKQ